MKAMSALLAALECYGVRPHGNPRTTNPELTTANLTTNNEENAMNTKLVKSAAVKALALGAMLMSTPAQAADFFVATTGNDGNPGTSALPFKTRRYMSLTAHTWSIL